MKPIDIKNIQDILKANADIYFDTKLSIKLAKLKLEIDDCVKIYNDVVTRLLNEFAIKEEDKYKLDDDGNILIKEGKANEWTAEYKKLEETDFDIKITFTDEELDQIKMTPKQASSLILLKENPKD